MDKQSRTNQIKKMTQRKRFWQTKIGHFLKGIIREIPIVGGLVDHIKDPEDNAPGKIDKSTLAGQVLAGSSVLTFILHSLGYIPTHVYEVLVTLITQMLE